MFKTKPAGNVSLTYTFNAVSGPLLVTTIVHVTTSPLLAVELDTNLIISKSASGSTFVVLLASLLSGFGSGVVELTTAMLVIVALVMFTIVVITKVLESPTVKSPIVQMPVIGSYLP